MFHKPRPVGHNTYQIDSNRPGYRSGTGSRSYSHRVKHGFENESEWKYYSENQEPRNLGSEFFQSHHPSQNFSSQFEQFSHEENGLKSHFGKGPKSYRKTDARIYEEICERLARDVQVDATNLEVHVLHGKVTLSGTVPRRSMKWRAEDVAESVHGVSDVVIEIRVHRH